MKSREPYGSLPQVNNSFYITTFNFVTGIFQLGGFVLVCGIDGSHWKHSWFFLKWQWYDMNLASWQKKLMVSNFNSFSQYCQTIIFKIKYNLLCPNWTFNFRYILVALSTTKLGFSGALFRYFNIELSYMLSPNYVPLKNVYFWRFTYKNYPVKLVIRLKQANRVTSK